MGKNKDSANESQLNEIVRQFCKNKSAVIGMCVFLLIVLFALSADLFFDYQMDAIKQNAKLRLQAPSLEHPFGTDSYGRDQLARVIFGARMSLIISVSSVVLLTVVGSAIGGVVAYYGGKLETVTMRIMDMFLAIPSILFAVTLVASLGASVTNLILALSVSQIPGAARFMRSLVMSLRDLEYIEAAKAIGTSDLRIMVKYIAPNAFGPVLVNSTSTMAYLIIATSSMSYVGLGIKPPIPEWGTMLAGANEYIITAPYLVTIPGLAIVITAMSINLFGDGLRDALDPRLK